MIERILNDRRSNIVIIKSTNSIRNIKINKDCFWCCVENPAVGWAIRIPSSSWSRELADDDHPRYSGLNGIRMESLPRWPFFG
jgi:hypothetical protein